MNHWAYMAIFDVTAIGCATYLFSIGEYGCGAALIFLSSITTIRSIRNEH